MPLPDALFNDVWTTVTTTETMTTEPTGIAFDRNNNPIGGIPRSLLDANDELPAGILLRRRHTTRCSFRRPPASQPPEPVFQFENGCVLYVVTEVCVRRTDVFFVHGVTEYLCGWSEGLASETAMAVRVCPDRFDVMGVLADMSPPTPKPPPLGAWGDDYVWIPPQTLPIGTDHAHFEPGPASGVHDGRLWNDEYLWHIVPPTRRVRCKIIARYRAAYIRRWVKPDGTLAGPPETFLIEPANFIEVIEDIPGCR